MLSSCRAILAATRHSAWAACHRQGSPCWGLEFQALLSKQAGSDAPEGGDAAAAATAAQPVDLEELRKVPGYLKGPTGRRVVRALGEEEWEAALDPRTSEPCWRNIRTGILTVPGIAKPDTWQEVVDKPTGLLYYWNRRTGETTDLGEPKPGPYGRPKRQSDSGSQPSVFSTPAEAPEVAGPTQAREQRGPPEKKEELTLFGLLGMLNSPAGLAFVGFSLLAVAWPYASSWMGE